MLSRSRGAPLIREPPVASSDRRSRRLAAARDPHDRLNRRFAGLGAYRRMAWHGRSRPAGSAETGSGQPTLTSRWPIKCMSAGRSLRLNSPARARPAIAPAVGTTAMSLEPEPPPECGCHRETADLRPPSRGFLGDADAQSRIRFRPSGVSRQSRVDMERPVPVCRRAWRNVTTLTRRVREENS